MTVHPVSGDDFELPYDVIVVTAGAVTRTFDLPGVADQAIGMKHVEEAVAVRDRLLTAFDEASVLPPGPERRRLLTVVFVGAGFNGVESFGELLSLANSLLKSYPGLTRDDLSFHLVEATQRILPEVTDGPRCLGPAAARGARRSPAPGDDCAVGRGWTRGAVRRVGVRRGADRLDGRQRRDPVVRGHTDLPVTARGLIVIRPDLRVGTADKIVPDAWAAGDDAAIPDLASSVPGALTVPNAQHAVRQGKLLAKNLLADLRGREPKEYRAPQPRRRWRRWASAPASSSSAGSSSRACWPGSCTAATTCSPYRPGTARSACSPSGW